MQAIISCCVCGEQVRRDDNPLAREHELPRRMLLFKGSNQVHASDYCDACFVELHGNVTRTEEVMRRANESEGGS